MERIEKRQNLDETITPISLFLDDLDYIYDVAKKYEHTIKLSDDEFSYDNIEEVTQKRGNKTGNLNITIMEESRWKSIELKYKQGTLSIYAWGTSDIDRLIWQDIKDYLQNKRPLFFRIIEPITIGPLCFLLCLIGVVLLMKNESAMKLLSAIAILYGALWLIVTSVKRVFAGVYLQRHHAVDSFWKRNADKLILIFIGAIIGGVLKWVFDLLSKITKTK